MKKKITKGKILVFLMLMTIISAPSIALANSLEVISGNYSLASQVEQNMQYDEDNSSMVYQKSNFRVQSMIADSGSSSCTWCHLRGTLKKKGFLGIYSTINSTDVNTPSTGDYTVKNYGYVGTGTFRFYLKNLDHQYNSGSMTVKIQDVSF